jgi:hypothetical protein
VPLANHPHRRRPIGGKSAPASVLAVEKKFERFEAFSLDYLMAQRFAKASYGAV